MAPGSAAAVPERGTRAALFHRSDVDFSQLRQNNVTQVPADKHIARHQVFPYALNVDHKTLRTQRTAEVKHPLRRKCHTPEKLSTYEHDFTVLKRRVRDDELKVGGLTSFGLARTDTHTGSTPPPVRDGIDSDRAGSNVSRFRSTTAFRSRGEFHEGGFDKLHDTQADTFGKLRSAKSAGRPMQLTMGGWGDTSWSPARFPGQIMGHTERQVNLIQTVHTLNLRAPDIAHIIR